MYTEINDIENKIFINVIMLITFFKLSINIKKTSIMLIIQKKEIILNGFVVEFIIPAKANWKIYTIDALDALPFNLFFL